MPEHYTDGSTDAPAGYADGTTDPLGDALDEIRQCLENAAPLPAGASRGAMQHQHDQLLALRDIYAPALLGAVAAGLKRHRPDHHKQPWCDGCGCRWPCTDYTDIMTALLGEEAADGH